MSFFCKGKENWRAKFLDGNLIRVAPECYDTGRLACLYCDTHTLKNDKGKRKKER
jgi:hypothetical protein